jgi:hypothetical protein
MFVDSKGTRQRNTTNTRQTLKNCMLRTVHVCILFESDMYVRAVCVDCFVTYVHL